MRLVGRLERTTWKGDLERKCYVNNDFNSGVMFITSASKFSCCSWLYPPQRAGSTRWRTMLKDASIWTRNILGDPSPSRITRNFQQLCTTNHWIRKEWAYPHPNGHFCSFAGFSVKLSSVCAYPTSDTCSYFLFLQAYSPCCFANRLTWLPCTPVLQPLVTLCNALG